MCYKKQLQDKNEARLEKMFKDDNTPEFIQDFFLQMASRAGRIRYYYAIKKLLLWLIEQSYVSVHTLSEITSKELDTINSAKIAKYFSYLKDVERIELTTLQTKRNQLSSFWEYMIQSGYVKKNIIKGVHSEEFKPAKTNRRKIAKMPLHEDVQEMISGIQATKNEFLRTRNMLVLRILRGTGLRESELANLDVSDVFLNEVHPYILVVSKGSYQYNDKGKDIVYTTKDATLAFEEWFKYRSKIEQNIIDKNAVFVNKEGKRLVEASIRKIFKKYSNGKITPHMMRHEYVTILQKESKDSTFVQEQCRWKSQSMMTVYDSGSSRSLSVLQNM